MAWFPDECILNEPRGGGAGCRKKVMRHVSEGIGILASRSLLPDSHEVSGFVLHHSSSQITTGLNTGASSHGLRPRNHKSSLLQFSSASLSQGRRADTEGKADQGFTSRDCWPATLCCCGKTALTRADVRNTLVYLMVSEQEPVTVGEAWQQVARAAS